MIRRMQIIHWVVMLINLMFCLSVMVLARRSAGRIRREHDSICDRILREGMTEIGGLRGIIAIHEDTIRDHKEQIANLEAEREEAAKRILSLEDSYNEKCVEMEVYDGEFEEIKQRLSDVWRFFNLGESIITTPTFQPKRPEDQPQKPMCDN